MLKKHIDFLILFGAVLLQLTPLKAQNLVPNPSFEFIYDQTFPPVEYAYMLDTSFQEAYRVLCWANTSTNGVDRSFATTFVEDSSTIFTAQIFLPLQMQVKIKRLMKV
jgi:hypothetical protein